MEIIRYSLGKRQHRILCEALRRFSSHALSMHPERIEEASTGLGTLAEFDCVCPRYMRPATPVIHSKDASGVQRWFKLTAEGAAIVQHWLNCGYKAADIDAGNFPPLEINGRKIRKPKYYRAPLQSRDEIVKFLTDHKSYYRSRSDCSPLAWDVKCRDADLSFDNLLSKWKESGEARGEWHRKKWLARAEDCYRLCKDDLWDAAIERARSGVVDDDTYKMLWEGPNALRVEYAFTGRSGGWLLMTHFEGCDLTDEDCPPFAEWSYKDLRNLYRLVVMLDHDFRPSAVKAEIEFQAAFYLFDNVVNEDNAISRG